MWFFGLGAKKKKTLDQREVQIQAIKKDALKKIDYATEQAQQLNAKIEREGVTELIWAATGGDRRTNK